MGSNINGIEYSFYGKSNNKLFLTEEILRSLNIGPDLSNKYQGKPSMDFQVTDLMLCYRAWNFSADTSGAMDSVPQPVELEPEDVEAKQKASMQAMH
jgi:hypothetical protein